MVTMNMLCYNSVTPQILFETIKWSTASLIMYIIVLMVLIILTKL